MYVSAVVLAAGVSRRMDGKGSKVLAILGGFTLLYRLVTTISRSIVNEVILVTGFQGEAVSRHAAEEIRPVLLEMNKKFRVVHNADFRDGMAVSFREGVKAVSGDPDAYLLFLGDQPLVRKETINRVIRAYSELLVKGDDHVLVHPRYKGKKGHPVLFSTKLTAEVLGLGPDDQVRYLTWKYRENAFLLDVDDPGIGLDVDTPSDLELLRTEYGL